MEKSLQNKEITKAKTKKLPMCGSYSPNSHLIDLSLSIEIFYSLWGDSNVSHDQEFVL